MLIKFLKNVNVVSIFVIFLVIIICVYMLLAFKSISLINNDMLRMNSQITSLSVAVNGMFNNFNNLEQRSENDQIPTQLMSLLSNLSPNPPMSNSDQFTNSMPDTTVLVNEKYQNPSYNQYNGPNVEGSNKQQEDQRDESDMSEKSGTIDEIQRLVRIHREVDENDDESDEFDDIDVNQNNDVHVKKDQTKVVEEEDDVFTPEIKILLNEERMRDERMQRLHTQQMNDDEEEENEEEKEKENEEEKENENEKENNDKNSKQKIDDFIKGHVTVKEVKDTPKTYASDNELSTMKYEELRQYLRTNFNIASSKGTKSDLIQRIKDQIRATT